jgi:toxin FitB
MNIVDSSGWLEYFANGPNADFFSQVIENESELIVPSLSIYEVFKIVLQQRSESDALLAVAMMEQGLVVNLDTNIALSSAKISIDLKLPLADSVMLATARAFSAILWTQDSDFKGIKDVQYIQRR